MRPAKTKSQFQNQICHHLAVSVVTFLMSFSPAKATSELSVVALIGECTDYLEKGSQQLTHAVQQRVTSIISAMRSKSIHADSPQQIGNLIAILSKLVPIQNPLFSELCDAVAALCIDREFVQFEDAALETVFEIVLKHLELRSFDPSPGLRALSTLLYNNTLRLPKFHERILEVALSVASVSDESNRRCCVLLGNLAAFSKHQLDHQIYIKAWKFLLQQLTGDGGAELLSTSLRALQLLILDAPAEVLDPQAMTHVISGIAFRQSPPALKFEAIMALKALANSAKTAFYAQWALLLTKSPSVFDLLKSNQRVAKASADLLTDIFRDTWKFLQIADNTSRRVSFSTLAQQIGDIVDVSFNRFLSALNGSGKDKLDAAIFNRVAKAFATFVRNCSFDSGRMKDGYIERIVAWCKSVLLGAPEEALIVLKSLLWTNIKCQPFAASFDYLFQTFVTYLGHTNPDFSKPAAFALCRMAYAYPAEVVQRYETLCPKLREIGPVHSLPILLRLAENGLTEMKIWIDILEFHIPKSFELNHQKSIQRSLQCIGLTSPIFKQLSPNLQEFCLSTALSSDYPEAAYAVGLLSRSPDVDAPIDFLNKALTKMLSLQPPQLQPLSNVLEAFSTRHKDAFDMKLIEDIMKTLVSTESPYRPRCIGFLFAFLANGSPEATQCMSALLTSLQDADAKIRWNAAAALAVAFKFGAVSDESIKLLVNALDQDRIAKVKIKSADALLSVQSRQQLGDAFHPLFNLVLQQLLIPVHFTHLALATQRKYDSAFCASLTSLFFKLLQWTTSRDFASLGDILVANVDAIYDLMSREENAPWEQITRLYEAKFNSIPSKMLEKFQDRAFPV